MGIIGQPELWCIKYRVFTFKDPLAPTVPQSYSQIGQDLFVVAMTRGKCEGSFLEIGAGHPTQGNNTYLLETEYGWSGVSIEMVCPFWEDFFTSWYLQIRRPHWPDQNFRYSELPDWIKDEITSDYALDQYSAYHDASVTSQRLDMLELWKDLRPRSRLMTEDAFHVDYKNLHDFYTYLQIDIEPPEHNLNILQQICTHIRFAIITFEHDFYLGTAGSQLALEKSRHFLSEQGYCLIVGKVNNFEDWWIHPDYVDKEIYQHYQQSDDKIFKKDFVLFL